MKTAGETIAYSLSTSAMLLQRFVEDLSPQEHLHRPTPKANCAAWLIGHLTLSDRRTLGLLGASDLPVLPEGFEKRFGRDPGCPEASEFGDVSLLMPLFQQHRQRLIDAVKKASPQQLEKPLENPRPLFKTVGEMANFMALHVAMHAGQISIIRRSLGRPPVT